MWLVYLMHLIAFTDEVELHEDRKHLQKKKCAVYCPRQSDSGRPGMLKLADNVLVMNWGNRSFQGAELRSALSRMAPLNADALQTEERAVVFEEHLEMHFELMEETDSCEMERTLSYPRRLRCWINTLKMVPGNTLPQGDERQRMSHSGATRESWQRVS